MAGQNDMCEILVAICVSIYMDGQHGVVSTAMCDYTQVEYRCGHLRYTVKSWCTRYQQTHKRCPANVVEMYVYAKKYKFLN